MTTGKANLSYDGYVTDVKRRRRGTELEDALLTAAWEELVEAGYAKLTMESVAARARTGIAVLYRRWSHKGQLMLAAIEHHREAHPVEIPDTGNLRDDLLAVLTRMSEARAGFFAVAGGGLVSGLLDDTGLTPADVRDRLLGGPLGAGSRTIYQRAAERGEIDLERVPPDLLGMPFDLVRHDLIMALRPPGPERLLAIVDDLFMPLVRAHLNA